MTEQDIPEDQEPWRCHMFLDDAGTRCPRPADPATGLCGQCREAAREPLT